MVLFTLVLVTDIHMICFSFWFVIYQKCLFVRTFENYIYLVKFYDILEIYIFSHDALLSFYF